MDPLLYFGFFLNEIEKTINKDLIDEYIMQTFETFHEIFCFFIRSFLDPTYVQSIDQKIELNVASKELKNMIQQIKSFHMLRKNLCSKISQHLKYSPILATLAKSRGLEQYSTVPEKSTCIISKETLKSNHGILIMIDKTIPVTIHSRYKKILYYYWVLAHFPEDIILQVKPWLCNQYWWNRGQISKDECFKRITEFEDKMFSKKIYIKLKGINQYIQTQLTSLPINNTVETV